MDGDANARSAGPTIGRGLVTNEAHRTSPTSPAGRLAATTAASGPPNDSPTSRNGSSRGS